MFSHTSDSQTLNTLRALSANGMLSTEVDAQIAADLLNGSDTVTGLSGAPGRGGSASPTLISPNRAADTVIAAGTLTPGQTVDTPGVRTAFGLGSRGGTPVPGRLAPLRNAPRPSVGGMSSDDEGGMLPEGMIQQLSHDCDNFSTALHGHTTTTKDMMHKALLDVFIRISQERLPDCFLRSLPKFGRGANKMAVIFNRSSNRRKTDNLVDRKELPFELLITDEVQDEMSKDIAQVVELELRRYFDVITTDMQRIVGAVLRLKKRLQYLEENLVREQTELRVLKERLNDSVEHTTEHEERIVQLNDQAKQKDTQMDILRDQVGRRNAMLDEQRRRFHSEIMRYKTKIFELQRRLDAGDHGGARRHSLTGDLGEMSAMPQSTTATGSDMQVMEAVDTATRELREQMLENIRKLKADHAREKKELLHQKKIAIDERDNDIYHLRMNLKSMDRVIEVEKRRMLKTREMEMKEIQEKYEQKIAALQAEIALLKGQG